jgi:hypothetical protein
MKLHVLIVAVVALALLTGCAGTTSDRASAPESSPTSMATPTLSPSDLDREFYLTLRNETERHVEQAPTVVVQTLSGGNTTEKIEGRETILTENRTLTVKLDREQQRYLEHQTGSRRTKNDSFSFAAHWYVTANRTYRRQVRSDEEGVEVNQHPTRNFTDTVDGSLDVSPVLRKCFEVPTEPSRQIGVLGSRIESIDTAGGVTTITYHKRTDTPNETLRTATMLRIDEEGWLRGCRNTHTSTGEAGEATVEFAGRIDTSPIDLEAPSWTANATMVSRSASNAT